jgi:hypothetical protein
MSTAGCDVQLRMYEQVTGRANATAEKKKACVCRHMWS